jgi:hypothetical protein
MSLVNANTGETARVSPVKPGYGGVRFFMANRDQAALDDVLFDWAEYEKYTDCEDVYFLSQKEIAVLLSLTRYIEWPTRWSDEFPNDFINNLIRKLTMNCVEDLIRSNLLIYGALTGQEVDLTESGMNTLLSTATPIPHANIGFDKWLNTEEGKTVAISLQEILEAIQGMQPGEEEGYTEGLTSIVQKINAVQLVLGFLSV